MDQRALWRVARAGKALGHELMRLRDADAAELEDEIEDLTAALEALLERLQELAPVDVG
jgi:hypothetical protein